MARLEIWMENLIRLYPEVGFGMDERGKFCVVEGETIPEVDLAQVIEAMYFLNTHLQAPRKWRSHLVSRRKTF